MPAIEPLFGHLPRRVRLAAVALLAGFCPLLASCVAIDKRDAFPVAAKPLTRHSLQTLPSPNSTLRPLRVSVDGRAVTAYYLGHPSPQGVLIFFGGSGNEVEASLRIVGEHAAKLGLDLVAFSYYQEGEEIPTVATVRAKAKAVYAAVETMHTPAVKSVYLLGHSLGG